VAVDLFLKIPEIPGESQKDKHANEIDIQSFSFGASNTSNFAQGGAGGGAGKANFQDVSLVKWVDKTSPKLFQACAAGTHFKSMTFTSQKAGDKPLVYYTLELGDVMVSSISNSGAGEGDALHESLTLNYATIKFVYTEQKSDNTAGPKTEAAFDVRTNKKI
jgi:type VI secretion system secreted protein Hcp